MYPLPVHRLLHKWKVLFVSVKKKKKLRVKDVCVVYTDGQKDVTDKRKQINNSQAR